MHKVRIFQEKNMERPKKVILGRKTFSKIMEESYHCLPYRVTGASLNKKNEILGLEVTISKRDYYIRVLPEKMKYIHKKFKYWTRNDKITFFSQDYGF